MFNLSMEERFTPYIEGGARANWQKQTAQNPNRGFVDIADGHTAAQPSWYL